MPAFLLPDLGEGLTEAEIVTWHVKAGDTVSVDQGIVEVETAKAVVEVPVPFAGRVTQLHGQPGDVVAVGQPLVTVDTAGRFAEPGVVTSRLAPTMPTERQRSHRLRHVQRAPSPSPGHPVTGRNPSDWPPGARYRGDGRQHRSAGRDQRPCARCLAADQAARQERGVDITTIPAPATAA